MDILQQCQKWHETTTNFKKIIDALEAFPPRNAPRKWTASWPEPPVLIKPEESLLECLVMNADRKMMQTIMNLTSKP